MRGILALGVAGALVAASTALAARQSDPPAAIFTIEQATAGKAAYARACASCHLPDLSGNTDVPPLAGTAFIGAWSKRTTKDLYDYTAASMPQGGPPLSADAYQSITAYILQYNGASAGPEAYTASTAVAISSLLPQRPAPAP